MRFLLIVISSLILTTVLQAQKKLTEGQFLYHSYQLENNKETVEGKAILLKRDQWIRFDYIIPALNPKDKIYVQMLINNKTDSLEMKMTAGGELLINKSTTISAAKKLLSAEGIGDYKIQKNKQNKKTLLGYKAVEYNCKAENENLNPSILSYLTPKISFKNHPLFIMLAGHAPLEGFPLEFDLLNNEGGVTQRFRIQSISAEKPDAIWFDLDKTPVYPLYPQEANPKETKKDALTPFLWKQYDLNAELVNKYEAVLKRSLETQLSSEGMALLKENIANAQQIEAEYERWINALGRPVGPDDDTGVKSFFTETLLSEMNALWENRIDDLVKTNERLIVNERLSAQARVDKDELIVYSPAQAFGQEKERYQNLTIRQAIAVLRHLQNNNRMLSAIFMNQLLKGKTSLDLAYDKFEILQLSPKPYILLGEYYESEIMLGARSTQANCSISVNGQQLRVEDGVARYKALPSTIGEQQYSARITIRNPLTGMTTSVTREFSYEVGVPSATIAADKMNVFYMGIDNPFSVAAAGIPSNDMEVTLSDPEFGIIINVAKGKYQLKPKKLGRVDLIMKSKSTEKRIIRTPFRIKRIPDPIVQVGTQENTGSMRAAELNQTRGLMTMLENFDFDAKCLVQSFQINYLSADGSFKTYQHTGAAFMGETRKIIQEAKAGDFIIFSNIKVRCNGDKASRRVSNLGIIVD